MKKDYQTEVGLLAIWNSESFSDIDTQEKYQSRFVNDSDMVDIMNRGQAVIWATGGDGTFPIRVRVNPEQDLSPEEVKFVEMKALNLKLVVTSGKVFIGTPEGVGSLENKLFQNGVISPVEGITAGNYLVNVYFLYHSEAVDMNLAALEAKLKENPDFDKNGYVVVLKRVDNDYSFPIVTELPQLG